MVGQQGSDAGRMTPDEVRSMLGGLFLSERKDIDCFSMLQVWADTLGVHLPNEYKGYNQNKFIDLLKSDELKALNLLDEYMASLGMTNVSIPNEGDIVVVKYNKIVTVGILYSYRHMIVSTLDKGIKLVKYLPSKVLRHYNLTSCGECE